MQVHELKTLTAGFMDILEGRRHFEWRRNDRGFHEGDLLLLHEFTPGTGSGERPWTPEGDGVYTGRVLAAGVDYVLAGDSAVGVPDAQFSLHLPSEFCVMEITVLACSLTAHGWGQTNLRRS